MKYISCKNCGEQFNSEYCPSCGQHRDSQITSGSFIKDYLDDIFSLDDKFFLSIKTLLLHPGTITKAFMKGRKSTYLSPMKLYLFIVFIFFTTLNIKNNFVPAISDFSKEISKKKIDKNFILDHLENYQYSIGDHYTLKDLQTKKDSLNLPPETIFFTENQVEMENLIQSIKQNVHLFIFFTLPISALLLKLFYRKKTYLYHLIHSIHLYSTVFVYSFLDELHPFTFLSVLLFLIMFFSLIRSVQVVYEKKFISTFFKFTILISFLTVFSFFLILALIIVFVVGKILLLSLF